MSYVVRITGDIEDLPIKNVQHVGSEGARRGTATLIDGIDVPVYNHPDDGIVWYEQSEIEDDREPIDPGDYRYYDIRTPPE